MKVVILCILGGGFSRREFRNLEAEFRRVLFRVRLLVSVGANSGILRRKSQICSRLKLTSFSRREFRNLEAAISRTTSRSQTPFQSARIQES